MRGGDLCGAPAFETVVNGNRARIPLTGSNGDNAAAETTDMLWSRFAVMITITAAHTCLYGHPQQSSVLPRVSIVAPAHERSAGHNGARKKPAGGNSDDATREPHNASRGVAINHVACSEVTQVISTPALQAASYKNCAGVKRARDVQGGGATDSYDTDWC